MKENKNQVSFIIRLVAFIIDISFIYGLSLILYWIFQLFSFFMEPTNLFVIISLLYFTITTTLIKGTPGKILCRLKVTYQGNLPFFSVVVLREIVYKILLFFVLPAYLLNRLHVNELFKDMQGIFYFVFHEHTVTIFLLTAGVILFLLNIIFKKTWYDIFAGTKVERVDLNGKKQKLCYYSLISIIVVLSATSFYNYLDHGNIYNPIIPKQSQNKLKPYISFLNQQKDAKEYLFELFEKYDIVILSERNHYEMTQYDFIYDVISDQRFIDNAGSIFTETGGINFQPVLDSFMNSNGLSESELDKRIAHILQNCSIACPVWDKTNLFAHLKALYKLNQKLAPEKRIRHYFTDIDFTWDGKTDEDCIKERRALLRYRDETMASNFLNQYEKNCTSDPSKNKCLVIMNYRHGFGPVRNSDGELLEKNFAAIVMEKYPQKSANVLINTVALNFDISKYGVSASSVQDGTWDNAFSSVGNKSYGFDFINSPFGHDQFDMTIMKKWAKYNYEDVFTGFVFYKPIDEHYTSMGFPGILDNNFEKKMQKRTSLIGGRDYAVYSDRLRLLKENEIVKNYASYNELLPKKNMVLELIILITGLLFSTWHFLKKT